VQLIFMKCTTNSKFYFCSNGTADTRQRSSAIRANRIISLPKLDVEEQGRHWQPCTSNHATHFIFSAEVRCAPATAAAATPEASLGERRATTELSTIRHASKKNSPSLSPVARATESEAAPLSA
jgi:hypothetical protein